MSGLPDDVVSRLVGYVPDLMDADVWSFVRERVLELAVTLAPATTVDAARCVRVLAYYLADAVEGGMEVDAPVEELFELRRATAFIAHPSSRPGVSASEYRSVRYHARALNPGGAWPTPIPGAHRNKKAKPYTREETAAFVDAVTSMRRGVSRERITAVVPTVLGCGATPEDILNLVWEDFSHLDGVGLVVRLPGGRSRGGVLPARTVPVAKPYRATVARLARDRNGPVIRVLDSNGLSHVLSPDSPRFRGLPSLSMTRSRVTWMVERVSTGVSLVDLAVASGVQLKTVADALDGVLPVGEPDKVASGFVRAAR